MQRALVVRRVHREHRELHQLLVQTLFLFVKIVFAIVLKLKRGRGQIATRVLLQRELTCNALVIP